MTAFLPSALIIITATPLESRHSTPAVTFNVSFVTAPNSPRDLRIQTRGFSTSCPSESGTLFGDDDEDGVVPRRVLLPFVYASTPDVNSLATDKPFLKWRSNRIIHGGSLFALSRSLNRSLSSSPFLFGMLKDPLLREACTLGTRETLRFHVASVFRNSAVRWVF